VWLLHGSAPATDLATTWWQYLALFAAVAASWAGVPFIGATAAAAAGVAASQGRLNLATTVVVITVAGEVGGLIGYRIGLRWGRQLAEHPGRHLAYRQRILAKGEQAYGRWGRLAVFFTPAIVSGTAKMDRRQFATWNLLDSLGFALFTVGGAYGIGKLVSGHHGAEDIAILIVGVGVGSFILLIVRRHHRRVITAGGTRGSLPPARAGSGG
jgi:membrane protein DedA with SNARE-associated domain